MFKSIPIKEPLLNPFSLIGDEWMLITAGNEEKFNTMTASWGQIGVMWEKPVLNCYIRPQRYTNEFVSEGDYFTASFFGSGNQREALALCGSKSGRDCDKVSESGLTPVFGKYAPYFKEARLVLCCRKIYTQRIDPAGFMEASIGRNYPSGDYHHMYIGEIVEALENVR